MEMSGQHGSGILGWTHFLRHATRHKIECMTFHYLLGPREARTPAVRVERRARRAAGGGRRAAHLSRLCVDLEARSRRN